MEREVKCGYFPPSVCYKILYTVPEEKRVRPALLKVHLQGADVPLTFSCTVKEEASEFALHNIVIHCMLNCVTVYVFSYGFNCMLLLF